MEYSDIIKIINNRKCPKCGIILQPQNMGHYWLIGCIYCYYLEDINGNETLLKNNIDASWCDDVDVQGEC